MLKTKNQLSCLLCVIVTLTTSLLLSGQKSDISIHDNDRIKKILVSGKTTTHFIYNELGKIVEEQSLSGWRKYYYDNSGRLLKRENAVDPSVLSGTFSHQRNKLITAETLTVDSYDLFEYTKEGRVAKIKHYAKMNGEVFEYRSMTLLIYEGPNIIKSGLHDTTGIIMQFTTFQYDRNGNVVNELYYSYSPENLKPTLIRETVYRYDDKKNPYKIYKDLAWPPYGTNTNNIIESRSTLAESAPGNGTTVSKTTYKYNESGFPVEELTENGKFEYQYQ